MKHLTRRIIFEDELQFENANAYTEQLAAQIEPSRHKTEGVLYVSEREMLYKIRQKNKRIKELEIALKDVIVTLEARPWNNDDGGLHSLAMISREILENK